MAKKLKISDKRYIDSDDIAEVEYTPPRRVEFPAIPKAHLSIELKSGASIELEGADANRVWWECQNLFRLWDSDM